MPTYFLHVLLWSIIQKVIKVARPLISFPFRRTLTWPSSHAFFLCQQSRGTSIRGKIFQTELTMNFLFPLHFVTYHQLPKTVIIIVMKLNISWRNELKIWRTTRRRQDPHTYMMIVKMVSFFGVGRHFTCLFYMPT